MQRFKAAFNKKLRAGKSLADKEEYWKRNPLVDLGLICWHLNCSCVPCLCKKQFTKKWKSFTLPLVSNFYYCLCSLIHIKYIFKLGPEWIGTKLSRFKKKAEVPIKLLNMTRVIFQVFRSHTMAFWWEIDKNEFFFFFLLIIFSGELFSPYQVSELNSIIEV